MYTTYTNPMIDADNDADLTLPSTIPAVREEGNLDWTMFDDTDVNHDDADEVEGDLDWEMF